jgi:hypothetical protein
MLMEVQDETGVVEKVATQDDVVWNMMARVVKDISRSAWNVARTAEFWEKDLGENNSGAGLELTRCSIEAS